MKLGALFGGGTDSHTTLFDAHTPLPPLLPSEHQVFRAITQ